MRRETFDRLNDRRSAALCAERTLAVESFVSSLAHHDGIGCWQRSREEIAKTPSRGAPVLLDVALEVRCKSADINVTIDFCARARFDRLD